MFLKKIIYKKKLLLMLAIALQSVLIKSLELNTIPQILQSHPEIEYIKCHDTESFNYKEFTISQFPELQPNKGLLAETFVLKIPNGQVCSWHGLIKVDNIIIQDLILHFFCLDTQIGKINNMFKKFTQVKKIQGKVAVITLEADFCFGHWIYNVLGRLALLEEQGIEYDWLYVACDKPFMKETLALWGIDPSKIIQPFGDTVYIQADELIVPSHIGVRTPEAHQYRLNWIPFELYAQKWQVKPEIFNKMVNFGTKNPTYDATPPSYIPINNYFFHAIPLCGVYLYDWYITFFQNKFLPLLENKNYSFSKKVFISREKAQCRKIHNEDEVFAPFEKFGFQKYVLEEMSFLEQIALFHQADYIVAASGSSLINLIFCKQGTKIIEIFQARCEACFYYASQKLNLEHYSIKTMDFRHAQNLEGFENTTVEPAIIANFIYENKAIFNS